MKVAVLGRGKTGGRVVDLCREKGLAHTVFSTANPPTSSSLGGHDVAIAFLPGPVFITLWEKLWEANLPVVSGCTGAPLPLELPEKLKEKNLTWIQGGNFSLGMSLIHALLPLFGKARELFEKVDFHLHEVHHVNKKDRPSGTALKWGEWLNSPYEISSERKGDTVGKHTLTLSTSREKITLTHEALDRKLFAQGALWAAGTLLKKNLPPGLHPFEDLNPL